jgi:aromatic-L-amino-acid decarboxylase
MGSKSIRAIDIDESHRMKPSALRAQIELDINNGITPIAIIATAGTTLTGAIDPLDEIATIADEFGIWLHIDGAYGISAAGTSRSTLFKGIERADSITIDAHKWLFVPKACSLLLIRDLNLLAETFSHHEAYMPHVEMKHNPVDLTLEYSRPLRSLKLWLGFKTHGADAFRQAIEANLELATLTYEIATRRGNYRLLPTPPQLSIIPIQYLPSTDVNISEFNAMLCNRIIEDGRFYISPAQIDGETWLRPCYTNFRTTTHDVEEFFNVIEEIAATISL